MKGGGLLHGLRGKQVSLILIALVCTTLFIWAWDRSSFLTTFVPTENQLLVPGKDAPDATSAKPDISVKEEISSAVPDGDLKNNQEDKSSNEATINNFPTKTTSETDDSLKEKSDDDKIDSFTANKEGENDAEEAGKTSEVVALSDSPSTTTPDKIIDDLNKITSSAERKDGVTSEIDGCAKIFEVAPEGIEESSSENPQRVISRSSSKLG